MSTQGLESQLLSRDQKLPTPAPPPPPKAQAHWRPGSTGMWAPRCLCLGLKMSPGLKTSPRCRPAHPVQKVLPPTQRRGRGLSGFSAWGLSSGCAWGLISACLFRELGTQSQLKLKPTTWRQAFTGSPWHKSIQFRLPYKLHVHISSPTFNNHDGPKNLPKASDTVGARRTP